MSAKRKHRTSLEYLKYLKGELTYEERHSFERDLEADSFDMEAMEGLERIAPGEAEADLLSLHSTLNRRLNRRRRIRIYSIAASVASLLIVGTFFINLYDFSPKSNEELIPDEETILHEESATQGAEMENETTLPEPGAPENKGVAGTGDRREAPVRAEEPVQEEALAKEIAADRKKADVQEEIAAPQKQAMQVSEAVSVEGKEAPSPAAEEIVSVEASPARSQKKGRAQEAPPIKPAESVSGIMVSSGDTESLPGAAMMLREKDSELMDDMDSLDDVVVVGYGAGKEAGEQGAVRIDRPDEETFKYMNAEPEGGLDEYKMYIEEQIRFPAGDTIHMKEVVVLKFNVEPDGTISDIQTLRSPGDPFTEEAIRLLKQGPAWNPARNENGPTDELVRMRIVFKK
jgi:TonB family protein